MNNTSSEFDDEFISKVEEEVDDWIVKSKLKIITGLPQVGVVRKARQERALQIFLMKYLTCSQYYPIGGWRIKLQLPLATKADSRQNLDEKSSMRTSIDSEGIEVFNVEFPYLLKSSPYRDKLPFTSGSISERLSNFGDNYQSLFEVEKYDGSKPIEKNYPPGFDISMMIVHQSDELFTLEIMVKRGLDL
jgi:hypothetical protein